VVGWDYVVVHTEDVAPVIHWYRDVLRLEILRREECRAGTMSVPSARVSPEPIIDIRPMATGARVPPHMDHDGLVVGATTMHQRHAELKAQGLKGEDTGRPAWGAQGDGQPLHRWDPEGHTTELRWSIGSQGA
jgi:hypothetical protein